MTLNGDCSLWFTVLHDDSRPRMVKADRTQFIEELAGFINAQCPDIPASEMHLWKVRS